VPGLYVQYLAADRQSSLRAPHNAGGADVVDDRCSRPNAGEIAYRAVSDIVCQLEQWTLTDAVE